MMKNQTQNDKKAAVIAVGNELMSDDGVGPCVLKTLSAESLPESFDLIDGGTGGMSLLHIIKDYNQVIFIDCADFGGVPGAVKVFSPEEVHSLKTVRYSLHEADLREVIQLSKKIQKVPETMVIIAIQPKRIEIGLPLSEESDTVIATHYCYRSQNCILHEGSLPLD
jgi:hydrogenase maturation protease